VTGIDTTRSVKVRGTGEKVRFGNNKSRKTCRREEKIWSRVARNGNAPERKTMREIMEEISSIEREKRIAEETVSDREPSWKLGPSDNPSRPGKYVYEIGVTCLKSGRKPD
jgi:hypothetical protein